MGRKITHTYAYTPIPSTHIHPLYTCTNIVLHMHTPHTHTCPHARVKTMAMSPHTCVCVCLMHTPTCTHAPSHLFSTCVHTQLLTHVPHAEPHTQCVHMPNAHTHAVTLPPSTGQHMGSCGLHTHTLSRESVRGPLGRPRLTSQLPPRLGLCLCSCSLSPKCREGAGRGAGGRGQATVALIKNFTPPRGPGPSAKPPYPAGGKPKAGFVHRLLGTRGPTPDPAPSPFRGMGSKRSWEGFCGWVLLAPAGCPPKASRHQMGLKEPSTALSQALPVGGWEEMWAQTLRPLHTGLPGRLSTCDFQI